jgi:hypothetical protein
MDVLLRRSDRDVFVHPSDTPPRHDRHRSGDHSGDCIRTHHSPSATRTWITSRNSTIDIVITTAIV